MHAANTGRPEVAKLLVAAGAKVNAPSQYGTALTWAAQSRQIEVARFLISKGAAVTGKRMDGITILMIAAEQGSTDLVRLLLANKADINAVDVAGETALSHAARRGQVAAARLLLASGAKPDTADARGWTPLMYAAANGFSDIAAALIEKGARVDATEAAGRTPLLLAAAYAGEPATVRTLLANGANASAKDAAGRTAAEIAAARGYDEAAQVLRGGPAATGAGAAELSPRAAVVKSLSLIERSMQIFAKRTGCTSCHQEGLALMATGLAQERGFKVDAALSEGRAKKSAEFFHAPFLLPAVERAAKDPAKLKYVPMPDVVADPVFLLSGIAAQNLPTDRAFAATAMMVAKLQTPNGFWPLEFVRVPINSTPVANTALAVRILQAYAPKGAEAELSERIGRAKAWFLKTPGSTVDELAFRLLGLKWTGATGEERAKAIAELHAAQRSDGGWAQVSRLRSDAYATGLALYALHLGGELPVGDAAYQRGVRFLLRTQDDDGSWFVNKRAIPANNYFDAGYPHGQSQYISFAGACWATMALTLAAEPAPARVTTGDAG